MTNSEKAIENTSTCNTFTDPYKTLTSLENRKTRSSLTFGFEAFNNHLSHYYDHCLKDKDKDTFKKIIQTGLVNELKDRKIHDHKNALKKIEDDKNITLDRIAGLKKKHDDTIKNFVKKFEKKSAKLHDVLNNFFHQRTITRFTAKSTRQKLLSFTPSRKFADVLLANLKNSNTKDLIQDYLEHALNNLSIWINEEGFKRFPTTHPHMIRGDARKKTIDARGFKLNPNPLAGNIKGKLIKGNFLNSCTIPRRGAHGYEDCHIWYNTTKAPTLFTFIPNHVWLPQFFSKLSDEIMEDKNNFVPEWLKYNTKKLYLNSVNNQNLISMIMNNTIFDVLGIKMKNHGPNNPNNYESRPQKIKLGSIRTKSVINNILDYINGISSLDKEYEPKGYKPTKHHTSLKKLIDGNKIYDLENWLKIYQISLKKEYDELKEDDFQDFKDLEEESKNATEKIKEQISQFIKELSNLTGNFTETNKFIRAKDTKYREWLEDCFENLKCKKLKKKEIKDKINKCLQEKYEEYKNKKYEIMVPKDEFENYFSEFEKRCKKEKKHNNYKNL